MELTELKDRLKRLDSSKLMDVVKNYKQYGYNEDLRNYAIGLLEQQGISEHDLQISGNLSNKSYEFATEVYNSYKLSSNLAFLSYILFFILKVIGPMVGFGGMALKIGLILCFIFFFIFLIKSFLIQSDFYKLTREEYGSDGALVYLLLGMPFYIVMYFVFRNQMNERMKMVQ